MKHPEMMKCLAGNASRREVVRNGDRDRAGVDGRDRGMQRDECERCDVKIDARR